MRGAAASFRTNPFPEEPMKSTRLIPIAVSLAALAGTFSMTPGTAAVPGPGGVIHAVQDYLGELHEGGAGGRCFSGTAYQQDRQPCQSAK